MKTTNGGFSSTPGLVAWAGSLALALGTFTMVRRMDVLHAGPEPDRSTKFYRAAYGWLLVSLVLLVALPFYLDRTGLAYSHAYSGAVRHAITVGFLSLMILGVAAKVVPTLCGADARGLDRLVLPFALVNLGCAMRVGFQVMTDFRPDFAFPAAGVSGLLEVTGIGIWGIGLWRVMNRRASADAADMAAMARPTRVSAADKVGPLVEAAPELLPIFLQHGFKPLGNPMFRRTIGRTVSISQACAMHGLDARTVLAELNAALSPLSGTLSIDERIRPEMTVAEVVRKFPGTALVFANRQIDACCGGTKPLAEVAAKHGLALDSLIEELEATSETGR
jgi:hypothetical protein